MRISLLCLTAFIRYGKARVAGIFSEETHAFSPGKVKAPQVDDEDAANGPRFFPVHTFHVGVCFSEPQQANKAGCSAVLASLPCPVHPLFTRVPEVVCHEL